MCSWLVKQMVNLIMRSTTDQTYTNDMSLLLLFCRFRLYNGWIKYVPFCCALVFCGYSSIIISLMLQFTHIIKGYLSLVHSNACGCFRAKIMTRTNMDKITADFCQWLRKKTHYWNKKRKTECDISDNVTLQVYILLYILIIGRFSPDHWECQLIDYHDAGTFVCPFKYRLRGRHRELLVGECVPSWSLQVWFK